MDDKKKEELQKMVPRRMASPFERFDFGPDAGLFRTMDRFFEDYLPRRWWQQFHHDWPRSSFHEMTPFAGKTPCVDVIDRETDFLIRAELPGVEKKDINISITNNILTLEASMSKEEKEEKTEYHRQEICRGSYRRSFELPAPVKESEAKASLKNGVLELVIPKVEKTKRMTIKVE